MKRLISAVLYVLIIFTCVSCGSSNVYSYSDRAVELGNAALETVNEFIDGSLTEEQAEKKLTNSVTLLDHCEGQDDVLLASAVFNLQYAVSSKINGTGSMATVKEKRDDLKDLLK